LNYHEGFFGTHSRSYISLQAKDNQQWKDVWNAIHGSFGAWGDKILFSAATSDEDAQNQKYKFLFYQRGIGVVDVHDLLRSERAKLMRERGISDSVPFKDWQYPSDGIVMGFDTSPPVEIKIELSRIIQMAEQVKSQNHKVVYCGNEFYRD